MREKRNAAIGLSTLLLSAGLAGCAGFGFLDGGCAQPVREPGAGDRPFEGWELKVLDHGAWSFAYAAIKPVFEEQTGATLVQIEGQDAGGALQEAILAKDNPVADLLYGIDNALFSQAQAAGIFASYESPELDAIDPGIDVDQFRDADGLLLATPADHGYINVNYDVRLRESYNESELPQNLSDLSTPRWASTFVTEDPRLSSPGLGFLLATIATFGESGDYTWKDYWDELLSNGLLVVPDWTAAYTYHYSGNGFGVSGAPLDKQMVVSYTTSPAAEVYYGSFESAPGVSLEPPNGVFHQVETVGILRCSPNLELAKLFVDFVLGPEFQSVVSETMAVYPVRQDALVVAEFDDLATAPEDLEAAEFSAGDLGARLEGWVQEWEEIYEAHQA